MAVTPGNQAQVLLDGFNLHQFAKSFQMTPQIDVLDTSVLGTTSRAKVTGLKHASASGEVFFDDTATTGSYDLLKDKYGAAVAGMISFGPAGFTLGNRVLMMSAHEASFETKSLVADLTTVMFNADAAEDAVDFGVSLHALAAEVGTVNGASVNNAAGTTNGGVGTLHVTAIAGAAPSVVIKIQHATDDSTWVDLITFAASTAANTSQRTEVAAGTTIRQYLRIVCTFGGTTTSITFQVSFARR